MDKDVAHTHTELLAIKKKTETGSFAVMWADQESVMQSEVRQKEKNKYHVLIHMCGI